MATRRNQTRSLADAALHGRAAVSVTQAAVDPQRLLALGLIEQKSVERFAAYLAAVERFRRRFGRNTSDRTTLAIQAVREAVDAEANAREQRSRAIRYLRELPNRIVALRAALEPSQFEFVGFVGGGEDRANFTACLPVIHELTGRLEPVRETIGAVHCAERADKEAKEADVRARSVTRDLLHRMDAWLQEVEDIIGDVRVLKGDEAAAAICDIKNVLEQEIQEAAVEHVPLPDLLERLEALRENKGRIEADLIGLHDDLGLATSLGHPAGG